MPESEISRKELVTYLRTAVGTRRAAKVLAHLLKSGVPALLVGLGWLLLVFAIAIGSSWNTNAGFWVGVVGGALMVYGGFVAYGRQPRAPREPGWSVNPEKIREVEPGAQGKKARR